MFDRNYILKTTLKEYNYYIPQINDHIGFITSVYYIY